MTCFIDPNKCLSWDVLLPYVQPYAYGVPDEVSIQAIRSATIEFCRRSGVLHDTNILDLQANVRDYQLETLCDYEIVRISDVNINGWYYRPSLTRPTGRCSFGTYEFGPFGSGYWGTGPYGFYMEQPNLIVLANPLSTDTVNGLRVNFVVQPKQDGCSFHNYLYEAWAEGLAAGAIARLQLMPKTDWYNPADAEKYNRKFVTAIGRARVAVDLNFTQGPMFMKTARFV